MAKKCSDISGGKPEKYPGTCREIEIPDGVTEICPGSFRNCSYIETVVIPCTVRTIGDSAFENCTALRKVSAADGVVTIGRNAFRNCRCLEEADLPGSVETIGENAFSGCIKLKEGIISRITDDGAAVSGFVRKIREHPLRTSFDMLGSALGNLITCEDCAYMYLYGKGRDMLGFFGKALSDNPEESAKELIKALRKKSEPESFVRSAEFICENSELISQETINAFYAAAVAAKAVKAAGMIKKIIPGGFAGKSRECGSRDK